MASLDGDAQASNEQDNARDGGSDHAAIHGASVPGTASRKSAGYCIAKSAIASASTLR